MIVATDSLAALLLTNRIVDVGAKPLSAGEFWTLCRAVDDPSILIGRPAADIARQLSLPLADAERYAALLAAGTAFAFERERLQEEGVRLVSALDDAFPGRLRQQLGDACPSFLLIGGPAEFLHSPALGVVGSRDASPEALAVAASAARVAAAHDMAVVSGLARGIDQAAMAAALDAGAHVIGFPADGIRVAAKSPDVRRRVHAGELCIASPYAPSTRFTTGNAMGRNKLIYALADTTLVVCSDNGSGGTWEGAREAMRRHVGRVTVWTGEGAGLGNAKLIDGGAAPIADVADLLAPATTHARLAPARQTTLFD